MPSADIAQRRKTAAQPMENWEIQNKVVQLRPLAADQAAIGCR